MEVECCSPRSSAQGCEVDMKPTMVVEDTLNQGCMQYGCSHYRRRCQIRAPCCNEVFDCRHCHNEAKNSMDVHPLDRHDVPRHEVRKVICSLCRTEQDVQQNCVTCGVCMGKYFCEKCNFFDDEDSKQQYHCDGCGICRTGGNDNFFHCYKCGCCYSIQLKDCHPCVEKAMHHNCPVCFEYLFDSTKLISVLPCGHTIHMHCLKEKHEHIQCSHYRRRCQIRAPCCNEFFDCRNCHNEAKYGQISYLNRIQWMPIHLIDMMYRAMKFKRFFSRALESTIVVERQSNSLQASSLEGFPSKRDLP